MGIVMNLKYKLKSIINEELNRKIKNDRLINEIAVNGKTIINVDIQPEYEAYIKTFNLTTWAKFLNKSAKTNKIVFLYNGADTLGMTSEEDYRYWLIEKGVRITDNAVFYDKGYAFFRYCMDSNIDQDNIVDLVQYMMKNNINDSRDIDTDMWNDYMATTGHDQQDVRDLLEEAGDMINIPDLMDFLQPYSNITLTGGGINECLKEVEIALLAMNKPFTILNEYTY
jgi:hypothetical protein